MNRLALVAEIGGSTTRIALAQPGAPPRLSELRTQPTPSGRLQQLLEDYLGSVSAPRPLHACAVAAAGGVRRLASRTFTSLAHARLTIDRDEIARATGVREPLLVNELAAVAAALPLLQPEELSPVGPPRVGAPGVRIVVGLGACLGVAVLTADGTLLETQAGQTDLPAVSAEERLLLNRLAPLGRLSMEALLSTGGLARLYVAFGGPPDVPTEAVVSRARSGEPGARKAVVAFSTWFGRAVGNLVLGYGAWTGVYLTGGVLDALGDAFDAPAFREGMEDKAPLSAEVGAVPVYRVRHPQAALLGLARLALG